MSNIYELKANKYKYKYFKLKQKYFGVGGVVQEEEALVAQIKASKNEETTKILAGITNLDLIEKILKVIQSQDDINNESYSLLINIEIRRIELIVKRNAEKAQIERTEKLAQIQTELNQIKKVIEQQLEVLHKLPKSEDLISCRHVLIIANENISQTNNYLFQAKEKEESIKKIITEIGTKYIESIKHELDKLEKEAQNKLDFASKFQIDLTKRVKEKVKDITYFRQQLRYNGISGA
jgi:hypothetical protein